MLEPIPAIDIIEGKCVRLTKGDYTTRKEYNAIPLDLAKRFEDIGFRRLHIVDLDGAKSSHVVNLRTLEQIAAKTSLKIDFGGGVKSDEDIRQVFNSGAEWVTVGSIAVKAREMFLKWLLTYGADHIILGADCKNQKISINGWQETGEEDIFDFLKSYIQEGVKNVLCTDIACDGMLQGPSLGLYKNIMQQFSDCQLIASGGVCCMKDLEDLAEIGVPYVVFGKAIYEGRIDLQEISKTFFV